MAFEIPCIINVIVFNHNHIIQTKAMIPPPPMATASFSIKRIPGVVFLVSNNMASVCENHFNHLMCFCRLPSHALIKLSTNLSVLNIERADPLTMNAISPSITESPSSLRISISKDES